MGKLNGDHLDPTAIDISPDPLELRMCGTTAHGWIPFDVPYMTEIAPNLWQGGCTTGLVLPKTIKHVVSLYPWERYKVHANLSSELYITMLVSARAMYLAGDMDTGRDIVTHLREVRSPAVLCNPSFEDEVLSWR